MAASIGVVATVSSPMVMEERIKMGQSLKDKVAIITGGGRGQGAAEARLFLEEGAKVVFTDLNEDAGNALERELGDLSLFIRHDVTVQADWTHVVQRTIDRFQNIDILINNAGITGYQTIDQITGSQMQEFLNVHLFGAMFGIQAVTASMSERGGSIVNVGSAAALRGVPGYVGYGVSKWALRGLSRYAAVDLVNRKIRVNSILPGGVETAMLNHPDAETLVARSRSLVPMKRFASAEELARAVLFLASDSSSYMTGSEIIIDGGSSA